MTAKFKLISIFLLATCFLNAQNFERDTIFLVFKENKADYPYNQKFIKNTTIYLNLNNGFALKANINQTDTIEYDTFSKLNIVEPKFVEDKVLAFREKTYGKYPAKGKAYQAYTKNDLFVTYVIEKLAYNKYALYKAEWREYLFGH